MEGGRNQLRGASGARGESAAEKALLTARMLQGAVTACQRRSQQLAQQLRRRGCAEAHRRGAAERERVEVRPAWRIRGEDFVFPPNGGRDGGAS